METLADDDDRDQSSSFPDRDEQEDSIFSNGVVWRTLAECLSFTDLKALRLVSRQFNQQVITETNFRQRALVNLTLDNSTLQKELFGKPNYCIPWKHFKIDLLCAINFESSNNYYCSDNLNKSSNSSKSDSSSSSSSNCNNKNVHESIGADSEINETSNTLNNNNNIVCDNLIKENVVWFYSLLKSADSLHIGVDKVDYYLPIELTLPLIFKILEAPDFLKRLKLDLAILKRENSRVPLSFNATKVQKENLENLQEFSIFSYNDNTILPFETDICFTGLMKKLKSVKIMSDLEQDLDYDLLRLKNNNNQSYLPGTAEEEDQGTVTKKFNLKIPKLLQLIEDNRTTITTLHLEHPQLWSNNIPTTMTLKYGNLNTNTWNPITMKFFPLLTHVVIRINEMDIKGIVEFIERQPFLQEIDITMLNLFPIQLLYVIAEKSKKLKRLRIKTKGFRNSVSNMWDFLKMSQIEDFQLDFVFSDRFSPNGTVCETIFPNLPNTISKLTLRRFPDIGFLNSTQLKFINPTLLTHLILKKSAYLVYDNTLEYIFNNFKMLQVLELTECVNCSDYGFTGIIENSNSTESKFSLTNLKGLKSLVITGCLFVSDETCFAIKFNEIRYIDLSCNQCITATGVHAILRNNPSLEILKTSEYDESLNDEVFRVWHPRLQKYIFSSGSSDSDCDEGSLLGFRLSNAEFSELSDDDNADD